MSLLRKELKEDLLTENQQNLTKYICIQLSVADFLLINLPFKKVSDDFGIISINGNKKKALQRRIRLRFIHIFFHLEFVYSNVMSHSHILKY